MPSLLHAPQIRSLFTASAVVIRTTPTADSAATEVASSGGAPTGGDAAAAGLAAAAKARYDVPNESWAWDLAGAYLR
jgi:hypothetical protein